MWPALFIIALIPLAFFWSDSVLGFFPQMAEFLPAKTKTEESAPPPVTNPDDPAYVAPENTQWVREESEAGYTAWAMSLDGNYRLVLGCAPGQASALAITSLQQTPQGVSVVTPTDPGASINYTFGVLPTPMGYASGGELIGALAQFEALRFQSGAGVDIARFMVDKYTSQTIARDLTEKCAG